MITQPRQWLLLAMVVTSIGLLPSRSWAQEPPPAQEEVKPPAEAKAGPLGPGDHARSLKLGEQTRRYLVHVPKSYDPTKPTPVVLALHGAAMNGPMMVWFSGLNDTADEASFIVVYPSGTGTGPFLTWNAGGFPARLTAGRPDDVAFLGKVLDELETICNVDKQRVYACGMSNGAMMCYRLAAEMSDRIAAIAPVAGTIAIAESKPRRPVPVIHFHGTKDNLVPFDRPKGKSSPLMLLKSVPESIETWVNINGCDKTPQASVLSKPEDETKVTRQTYAQGKEGAEVVLIVIDDGGHTWPGKQPPVGFIGKSAKNISANALMWEFFQKHPLK